MDDFFLKWLQSIWPVAVTVLTIVFSAIKIHQNMMKNRDSIADNRRAADQRHEENEASADLRDERLRHQIELLQVSLPVIIGNVVNGKLDSIKTDITEVRKRASDLELNVAAIKAVIARPRQ